MHIVTRPLVTILLISAALTLRAENNQVDVNLMLTATDAGGNDDFKSGRTLTAHYNWFFRDWLAADAGLVVSERTLEESRKDVVGDFRTSYQTQAILLGLKPRYRFTSPYEVYGRLGLQFWRTELEVEEYFGPGIPAGKDSAKDTGYGYYVSIGGAYYVTDRWLVQLEFRHMQQLDVFEGKTVSPFDLTIDSFGFGVGYRF